jgi:hypothetical protein
MRATRTAFETPVAPGVEGWTAGGDGRPVVRTEIVEPQGPPGIATARWAPPPGLDARIDPPPSSRTPPPASKPPSSVETTMADAEGPPRRRGTPGRALLLVVACFLLGALGMGTVAWRGWSLGRGVARVAQPAPPGIVAAGPEPDHAGVTAPVDTPGGLPSPVDSSLPPLLGVRTPGGAQGTPAAAARAVIDASSGRPGVGQPVDFSARVLVGGAGHPKTDGAHFRISGPGIGGGTEVPAADDGSGVFRATFTFLQGGRFEVVFLARVDGAPVRAARTVAVDAQPGASPAAPASGAPGPVPSASSKWM